MGTDTTPNRPLAFQPNDDTNLAEPPNQAGREDVHRSEEDEPMDPNNVGTALNVRADISFQAVLRN